MLLLAVFGPPHSLLLSMGNLDCQCGVCFGNSRAASLSVVGIFAGIDPVAIDIYGLSELMNLRGIALMADVAFHLSHLQGNQYALITCLTSIMTSCIESGSPMQSAHHNAKT